MKNLVCGLAFALLASTSALAQTAGWRVSESTGSVQVLSQGLSKAATGGSALALGDTISTGRDGRAVLVRGQEFMIVAPNSRVRIVAPEKPESVTQIFEEIGNVVFKINKKSTPHFGVQTPYLAAVVKGTTFSVTVTDAGSSVQVTEGAVQVSTLDGGEQKMLTPGMIGMVGRDQQSNLMIDGDPSAPAPSTSEPVDAGAGQVAEVAEATEISPNAGGPSPTAVAILDAQAPTVAPGIAQTVSEGPISLSALSGGMVTGDPTLGGASARAMTRVAELAAGGPGNSENSNAGGSGNGNPGSSNAGGNGNGNADNSNAGGNGNGNSANSNAGGNGNGNSANSNAGGNGNGNSGSSNAGGNGNSANSNGGGNGNGNGAASTVGANSALGQITATLTATGSVVDSLVAAVISGSDNAGGNGNGNSGASNAGGNGNGRNDRATD